MKQFFRAVAALTALLALAGCAQLPRGGAIGVGPDIEFESDSNFLYYSPSAPSEGDSPQQILSGFLSAGNGPQNDYAVARSYLTPSFQSDWQPSAEVLVQDGSPSFTFTTDSQAVAEITVSAVINSQGVYEAQPPGTKRYLNFELRKQAGEWRIVSAPNLTSLIRPNFSVLFKAYQLYFFDQNHSTLVPDVRWFPSRTSTATQLVQALLQGPQSWMAPALANDFPENTALNLDAVTVVDGVANVDLTGEAIGATVEQLAFMKAQLKATLLQIPSVTSVSLSINKSPVTVPELRVNVPSAAAASLVTLDDSGIFGSTGQSVVSLTNAGLDLLRDSSDFALSQGAESLALSTANSLYRLELSALDKSPRVVDTRAKRLSPEFDAQGYLWSVGSAASSAWISAGKSSSSRISTRQLQSTPIQQFSLSPDGTRVAVLYAGQSANIWLHSVIRDESGRPIRLGAGIKIDNRFGQALSIQWTDAINLAVLVRAENDGVRPTVMMVGGETKTYPVVLGGVQMIANLSIPAILIKREDGTVVSYKSSSWVEVANQVRAMHFVTLG